MISSKALLCFPRCRNGEGSSSTEGSSERSESGERRVGFEREAVGIVEGFEGRVEGLEAVGIVEGLVVEEEEEGRGAGAGESRSSPLRNSCIVRARFASISASRWAYPSR